MKAATVFLLLLAAVAVHTQQTSEQSILIVELTRHGARVPIYAPADLSWAKGLGKGELTPVGHRQHFLLGKQMAQSFPDVFTGKLHYDEYYVRSSQFQRTTTSALAHIMGVWDHFDPYELDFASGDHHIEPPSISHNSTVDFKTPLPKGFIPSPVHTETIKEDDTLFLLSSDQCLTMQRKARTVRSNVANKAIKNQDFLNMVDEVAKKFGIDASKSEDKFELCNELSDLAIQDARNNPKPVLDVNDELYKKLSRCYEVGIIAKYEDTEITRVVASNFMYDILKKINTKVEDPKNKMKYYLYAAHDSTLSPVLILSGQLNAKCFGEDLAANKYSPECKGFPDTASNIVFEVVKEKSDHFVRAYYNFEPYDICKKNNPDQRFRCPVKEFDEFWRKQLYEDWEKRCEKPSRLNMYLRKVGENPWKLYGYVIIFVNVLLLIGLVGVCVFLHSRKRIGSSDAIYRDAATLE